MAELLVVGSLALFVALVVAFAYVARQTARVVAATREDEAFRRDGASLADRSAALIWESCQHIDRVRRRQDAPSVIEPVLRALLEGLAGLRVEADALDPPLALAPIRQRLAEELERATRAVEMVDHGCALLGVAGGRPRGLEGETSVKRGYLNLLHAREAIVSLGLDLRAGRLGPIRWFSERSRAD